MAHIFSLASPAPAAYHEGSRSGDQVKFPDSGFFKGFNKPSRLEGDIFELETTGTVYHPRPPQSTWSNDLNRYRKILMAHSIAYNQIIGFHLYSKKTFTSTEMAPFQHFGSKTAMSISGNATYTQIASKQRQKRGGPCWGDIVTRIPITKW